MITPKNSNSEWSKFKVAEQRLTNKFNKVPRIFFGYPIIVMK
jgi:hypothetical protein